ncbi:Prolipoprotein diacylglyceryl transferase [Nitrospina gracilis 3/211]|uniref:Phosphatidylglycerol--prolipoprotein diacylglyceryl transferase n=1 Tax=Nitrospina gracilis (strain 3/211) TaxID=1266370 RepID=M1YZZ8_NITG3|nr:prolipoprotein diacylglyceryl transferase [Nitrospina gracilis]MCF8724156.1 phosphatidylglycerol:prolipoprotein diacylglycerol transferase [Nitrospina sp. Nb-3]CCQ91302.1 Prolipoprotein diacylglyceryl transferase [Nitrospina gracilis 3/211]
MHPILLEFGILKIFTYGLLVATGFFVGIVLAARQGQKEGLDSARILDLCFYLLIASILGGRLLYVIVEYRYFVSNPLEMLKFWKGGLVYYGGLMAAVATGWYFMRKFDLPFWKTADVLAPSIAIGQAIGRWGCFFAGCCYGVRTDAPWAITFTNLDSLAPLNVPLHPTQIYLSLNALVIFFVLLWVQKKKRFDGQVLLTYGILYSIGRFIIEFYRGDDRGYAVPEMLSTSQFIGIFIFGLSMVLWARRKRTEAAKAS